MGLFLACRATTTLVVSRVHFTWNHRRIFRVAIERMKITNDADRFRVLWLTQLQTTITSAFLTYPTIASTFRRKEDLSNDTLFVQIKRQKRRQSPAAAKFQRSLATNVWLLCTQRVGTTLAAINFCENLLSTDFFWAFIALVASLTKLATQGSRKWKTWLIQECTHTFLFRSSVQFQLTKALTWSQRRQAVLTSSFPNHSHPSCPSLVRLRLCVLEGLYYRKRGSASYIVRQWLLWEGERERERETPVTSLISRWNREWSCIWLPRRRVDPTRRRVLTLSLSSARTSKCM